MSKREIEKMIVVKKFAALILITTFVVSCQSAAAATDSNSPSPANTTLPSSTLTAISTESILLYGETLLPQAGQIYKLETETSSYQRLWVVHSNQNTVFHIYSGWNMGLSPDLQFGAYISNGDIWLLDLRSGKQINLTRTPDCFEDNTFSWSPDSTEISYFGCQSNSQLDELYIIDIFSKESRNLTKTPDKNENLFIRWWGAQPNLIFFGLQIPKEHIPGSPLRGQCHTQGGECVYLLASIHPDGTGYREIDNVSGVGFPPSLSPDGKAIAYDGGILYNLESQLYQVINPSEFGISASVHANADGLELVQPIWSPSGRQIVWLGHVAPQNKDGTAIYLFDLTSHTGKIIYNFDPCYFSGSLPAWQRWTELHVNWSSDEQFLAIISDELGESSCEYTLQVFDKDSNMIQRYEGVGFRSLIWSPDSRYLAFRYFIQSNKRWITLLADVSDWQLHPLDIPENAILIKW